MHSLSIENKMPSFYCCDAILLKMISYALLMIMMIKKKQNFFKKGIGLDSNKQDSVERSHKVDDVHFKFSSRYKNNKISFLSIDNN